VTRSLLSNGSYAEAVQLTQDAGFLGALL